MSDMKCPFCNGELYGCIGHPYCRNEKCEMCDEMMPQELLDLLERTRKALEIAVDALNTVTATPLNSRVIHDVGNKALEQITALEQKEHFADASKKIEQKE